MSTKYEEKMSQLQDSISKIIKELISANELNLTAYKNHSIKEYDEVKKDLKNIKDDTTSLDEEIVKVFTNFKLESKEFRVLVIYLKIINELLKISDNSRYYAKRMKDFLINESDIYYEDATIIKMQKTVIKSLNYLYKCISNTNCDVDNTYVKVLSEDSKIDDLYSVLEKNILNKVVHDRDISMEYVNIIGTLHKFERISERCVEIANLLCFAKDGKASEIYKS